MNISNFKIIYTYIFGGGVSGVVEYLLNLLKDYLASLDDITKDKIQSALNIALKVLNSIKAFAWLVPTKWQSAYDKTILAVETTVSSLEDLEITKEELDIIIDRIAAAINSWKSPDDETCV